MRNQSGQDPLNFPIKINNRLASLLSSVNRGDGRPIGNAAPIFDGPGAGAEGADRRARRRARHGPRRVQRRGAASWPGCGAMSGATTGRTRGRRRAVRRWWPAWSSSGGWPNASTKRAVGDEARGAPAPEARERASHPGVEVEQPRLARFAADADAVGRVEAEDARLHVGRARQHAGDVLRRQRAHVLLPDDDRVLVGRARSDPPRAGSPPSRGSAPRRRRARGSAARCRERGPASRSAARRRRARCRNGRSRRLPDRGADREPGRLDGDRGAAGHRIHERLEPRVPPREHDQLRRQRLAQRRRARRRRARRDDAARQGRCRCRRRCGGARACPARRATNTTSGASASTSAVTPRDASASTSAFFTTPRSWSGARLEIVRRSEVHREAQRLRGRQPVVGLQRRQQFLEERLEPHGGLENRSHEIRDDVR